jgi:hypothetical protein
VCSQYQRLWTRNTGHLQAGCDSQAKRKKKINQKPDKLIATSLPPAAIQKNTPEVRKDNATVLTA